MAFIIITTIIVYFILIAWTWQSLSLIERPKKLIFILLGTIIVYGITFIVFQITKGNITYPDIELQAQVQNILILIFTGINGIIVLPQIAKIADKIIGNEVEKEKIQKRILILALIFIICLIFESGYMKDIQEGIINIYHARINCI